MNTINSIYASKQLKTVIWQDFIKHFRNEVTALSYQTDICEFMNFSKADFIQLSAPMVDTYFHYLEQRVKANVIKPNTMAKKFRELHSFAMFMYENREKYQLPEVFQDYFFPYLKLVAKIEKYAKSIPIEDIDKLLFVAQDDLMAYCILTLMYRVGLASTEIVELKDKNFAAYDNGVYAFVEGRKEPCFIPEDVFVILEQYMASRQAHEYLFYNSRNNQLNIMYISRLMKKYTQLAGIPSYSAETLRNACAFTMFSYSAEPEQVARQMGITQIQIKRYKDVSYRDNLLREANQLVKLKVEPPQ
ncbi:MAG: tyrosine-type recombinase/integrase [Lachnospiraceae bacterium]|nr:tyrosine-type recombinase/integrase [Lachnospiraceae bacterium]